MAKLRLTYWLPRVLVIGFCLSLLLPAPAFLSVMDDGQMVVWAARLIWVVGLPAVFCIILMLVAAVQKHMRGKRPGRGL